MMESVHNITDDNRDSAADSIIQSCLDLKNPKSFFLFAGAGSGKTRSLVSALDYINMTFGRELKLKNRMIAVITYTKAARDEIKRRCHYNPLFEISTIHSFAWKLIYPHTEDIRTWLKNDINTRINEAETKLASIKNKAAKSYKQTEEKLSKLKKRLQHLDSVKRFIYNPDGINSLSSCWKDEDPPCRELLQIIYDHKLFPISRDLQQLLENPPIEGDEDYQKLCGLSEALEAPFSEIERYWEYINGNASFDTHQGVKGLEFDRVMVIIDEKSSQGTMFNYDKLLGIASKSSTDLKNELEGKETTLDRTRRLLYVTCSRAINSLAIVYYTDKIEEAICSLTATGWFEEKEIKIL